MTQWITVPVDATDEMVDAAECVEDLYRRGHLTLGVKSTKK